MKKTLVVIGSTDLPNSLVLLGSYLQSPLSSFIRDEKDLCKYVTQFMPNYIHSLKKE